MMTIPSLAAGQHFLGAEEMASVVFQLTGAPVIRHD